MLVIAHHNISDPEGFWSKAQEVTKNLPANLKVVGVFPSKDAKTGTCLWEADNAQEVQQFLDEYAGQYATNFCYELDVEKSMGLPKIQLEEVHTS
jgi:phosphoribosylanthranilate isomerase